MEGRRREGGHNRDDNATPPCYVDKQIQPETKLNVCVSQV